MNKNLEIVAMIYKSVNYLKMIHEQISSPSNQVTGWNIGYRIVANDATEEVIQYLLDNKINCSIYNDSFPADFYLNRVYRCWNYCVKSSEYDNVCLVNSDMVFSDSWLSNLLKHHDGTKIPCSRLVESGKMPSGLYGVSKDFGKSPTNIKTAQWQEFSKEISEDRIEPNGLYMPCVFSRESFLSAGCFPEGNVFKQPDGSLVSGHPNDRPLYKSGDKYFFEKLEKQNGLKHITVFDSLVYHIQEGEMDE